MRGQRRTASVIPSVMLSVAAVLIMFIILGGIIQYYTSIANEPPLLPAYGTLYVLDADSRTGTVRIVNRFGYPVKALFSISVDSNRIAADMNITITPIVSFWATIGPGEVTVNIYQYLERYLGVVKPEYVRWDESGFLIGNTFFPLQRGVGAPRPPGSPGSQTTNRQYTLTGIGTSYTTSRQVFATKYFDGSQVSIGFTHSSRFGYSRSICGYRTVRVMTTDRYGSICDYGYCSLGCREDYCCGYDVNGTCVRWCCSNTNYLYYSCDSTTTPSDDYATYPCGLDGVTCNYWTPSIETTASASIRSLSLRGVVNDPGGLAVDRNGFTLSSTSASTRWEYILPQNQQSACVYTYREIYYWTSFTSSRVCCSTCSGTACATTRSCSQSSSVTRSETRHACQYALGGSWWCAGLSTFLVGELTSGDVIVEVRQAVDGIAVRFNMTLNYRYTRYYDPELSDSYMRIMPVYIFTLTLPPIRGYFSIPYNEVLKSATASASMSVSRMVATVRTGSGYVNNYPLIEVAPVGWSGPVSTTPVGYVALPPSGSVEGAKTFYFTTTSSPVVYLIVRQESSPYVTVPMCSLPCNDFGCSCSDTVTINVIVDVLLGVGVTINTTTS
ncbi:MAG: hypothetical protein QXU26_01950 [Thermofilaceae archaeon]